METHLTIKHLAPYLPYGLNVYVEKLQKPLPMICLNKNKGLVQVIHDDRLEGEIVIGFKLEHVKPILRSLSSLTKDELHIFSVDFRIMVKSKQKVNIENFITLTDAEWLFKNYIDVYGLIDKGLAVSIHDVEQVIA